MFQVRYESHNGCSLDSMSETFTKHASLFTWITLQSIPEETIISPNILDFLELALEPLPTAIKPTVDTKPGEHNGAHSLSISCTKSVISCKASHFPR